MAIIVRDELAAAMQRAGLLEDPPPPAAVRWLETFLEAHGAELTTLPEALALVRDYRNESVVVPALALEKLRSRQAIFFLDAVGQHVNAQPELRGLALDADIPIIAEEFGIAREDAFWAVRMALSGKASGPDLALVFPLLGHDRILMRIGAISSHLLHGRGLEPIPFGPDGSAFEPLSGPKPESA
jgi:hypothetical protein